MADADKPIARLAIDSRAYGPLICEHCADSGDETEGEREEALLMEDGGIVCEECHTPFKAFEQFSAVVTSVQPVRVRRSTGARGGDKGFEIVEENPSAGGCDGAEDSDEVCPGVRYYADTKSFFCDKHRAKFLKDYRWDDSEGAWVERS